VTAEVVTWDLRIPIGTVQLAATASHP